MNFNKQNQSFRFSFYSIIIIIFFVIVNLLRWYKLPTFIDIYYHLSVLEGFDRAGGYVTSSFWEFAPIGRPHIYPPLTHILMLIFYKLGFSALFIGKIFEFCCFPLLLLSIWYVLKKLFTLRLAFFSVLIASGCYSFYLSAGNLIPATFSLLFGLLAFLFIEKDKLIASSLLLAFSFYCHAGMPLFLSLVLLIYGLLNRDKFKQSLVTILSAVLLSLPLLIHQFNSLAHIDFKDLRVNFLLEINLFIYLSAIIGLIFSAYKKRRYCFFISLFLAMIPFSFIYKHKYLSGQGMIGLIFLSGVAFDGFYEKIKQRYNNKKYRLYYLLAVILIFFALSPSVYIFKDKVGILPVNSTYFNLVKQKQNLMRSNEISIHYPKIWRKTASTIKENFNKENIIYSNGNYVAGIVSVYTKNPTSTAMLPEVRPYKEIDPMKASRIIIWFKRKINGGKEDLKRLVNEHRLDLVGENEFVYIYKNPDATSQGNINSALIPTWLLFTILAMAGSAVIFDIKRKR